MTARDVNDFMSILTWWHVICMREARECKCVKSRGGDEIRCMLLSLRQPMLMRCPQTSLYLSPMAAPEMMPTNSQAAIYGNVSSFSSWWRLESIKTVLINRPTVNVKWKFAPKHSAIFSYRSRSKRRDGSQAYTYLYMHTRLVLHLNSDTQFSSMRLYPLSLALALFHSSRHRIVGFEWLGVGVQDFILLL